MAAKRKDNTSGYKLGQMEYNLVLRLQMYHDSKILNIIVVAGEGEVIQHNG